MNSQQPLNTDAPVISDIVQPASTPPVSVQPPKIDAVDSSVKPPEQVSPPTTTTAAVANSADDLFEATDNIPDMSQQMSTATTNTMQAPRIYDTKEYFVPIHETTHSHGVIGTVIAGMISVVIVLAIVFALAYMVQ